MQKRRVVVLNAGQGQKRSDVGHWDVRSILTSAGEERAKKAVHVWFDIFKACTLFFTSPLLVAQQTLFAVMIELGYHASALVDHFKYEVELWTHQPETYDFRTGIPNKAAEWVSRNMAKAIDAGEDIYDYVIRRLFVEEIMHDGDWLLCITHNGPIELLYAHCQKLAGHADAFESVRDFGPCEGFVIEFRNGQFAGLQELRFSD